MRLHCKYDITNELFAAIRKQMAYGRVSGVFEGLRCKYDITKELYADIRKQRTYADLGRAGSRRDAAGAVYNSF
jgi:hypothetical protein